MFSSLLSLFYLCFFECFSVVGVSVEGCVGVFWQVTYIHLFFILFMFVYHLSFNIRVLFMIFWGVLMFLGVSMEGWVGVFLWLVEFIFHFYPT